MSKILPKDSLFDQTEYHSQRKTESLARISFYMQTVLYYLNRIESNLSYHDLLYREKTSINYNIGAFHSIFDDVKKNYNRQKLPMDIICSRCGKPDTAHPDDPQNLCAECRFDKFHDVVFGKQISNGEKKEMT